MRTAEEVWREASAAYEDAANEVADLPMRDMVIAGDAAATAILAQRDAEMLAEGARQEREAIVAWLKRENGLCDCYARSEGECGCGAWDDYKQWPLERVWETIKSGQHKETNGG